MNTTDKFRKMAPADKFRKSNVTGRRFNQNGMIELIPADKGYSIKGMVNTPLATVPTIKAANEWLNGPERRYI